MVTARVLLGMALLLALIALGNGLYMVSNPVSWYGAVPGVHETGPANVHFITDIGFAYLTTAALLFAAVYSQRQRGGFAFAAAIWPALHAGFHIAGDVGGSGLQFAGTEFFGIYLPAAVQLALGVYWLRPAAEGASIRAVIVYRKSGDAPMLNYLVEKIIASAERRFGVSFDYARDMYRVSPRSLLAMRSLMKLGHRREACPATVAHAAHLAAALTEDCGPCVQIAVNMALEEGMAPVALHALIDRRLDDVDPGIADAFLFGEAVARGDAAADQIRPRLAARYGEKALVDLAFGIAIARTWPAMKRALGHAQFCQRVFIDGNVAPVLRAAAAR